MKIGRVTGEEDREPLVLPVPQEEPAREPAREVERETVLVGAP